jgi:hypothetical protein
MGNASHPLDTALLEMHEHLWDDERGMVKLYGLHLVRETALGAFLDLEQGRSGRAERALRAVLECQYPSDVDSRWAGTFRLHPAQPLAGSINEDGRVRDRAWLDYDPNWRQFLGIILWLIDHLHGDQLPDTLRRDIRRAITTAARGEPSDRITAQYTNVALLHSALCDLADGSVTTPLATAVVEQVRRDGDIAEYNSPTYDAVSLFAACLILEFSTDAGVRNTGEAVLGCISNRLATLWHPALGLQAAPYSRAYGLDPRLYVSLMSVLMTAIDVPAAGPTRLDNTTTHIHDLYFLPLFRRVCRHLRDRFVPRAVTTIRRHEQRFGDIVATSLVEPTMVVGWEHGRRSRFALDQYTPFAMYSREGFIGVRTRPDTDWVDVTEVASHVYELRCARRANHPTNSDLASLTIVASRAPITHENEMIFGDVTLQFPDIAVEVRLAQRA